MKIENLKCEKQEFIICTEDKTQINQSSLIDLPEKTVSDFNYREEIPTIESLTSSSQSSQTEDFSNIFEKSKVFQS